MTNLYEAYCSLGEDAISQVALEIPCAPPKEPRVCSAKAKSRLLPVVLCPASFFEDRSHGSCIFKIRKQTETPGVPKFAGLTFDKPVSQEWRAPYNSENQILADEFWTALELGANAGLVALTNDYAKTKDLCHAQASPWQDNMDIFCLNGLQIMHCLRNVRWAFFEYRDGEPQSALFNHINDCMKAIRQDLMCFKDDTPSDTRTARTMESGVWSTPDSKSGDKLQDSAKEHTIYFRLKEKGRQAQ